MNKGFATGLLFMLIGLALAAGPQYVFPPCEPAVNAAGHAAPMRCWWTARAEIGVGLAILFAGILVFFVASAAFRSGVAATTLALAVLAAALPLGLIGVCESETMRCRMAMLPALVILSAVAALAALFVAVRGGGKTR